MTYSQLLAFSERYLQQNEIDNPHLEDLRTDTHQVLSGHIRSLEQESKIELLHSENKAVSIFYETYIHEKIHEYYARINENAAMPLATEDNLGIEIPDDRIHSIEIKTDFVQWLNDEAKNTRIVRLLFPSGISSLSATTDLLQKGLIIASIQKIRQYLQKQRNNSYLAQKLVFIFKGREVAVRDLMRMITQSAESALRTILKSSDFSFQMWTQMSTFIIKEFEPKGDKTEDEHNFCQAAYLIGYYCVYYKGKEQKKKDVVGAIKSLEGILKRPPYAFTLPEIYNLKDDKGIPLLKKFGTERLHAFLEEQTKTEDKRALPALLTPNLPSDHQVYIYTSSVGKVLGTQKQRASTSFRDFYKNSWYSALMDNDELNTMINDEEFRKHITNRLREHFPLLFSLLRFEFLYLMTQEKSVPDAVKDQCSDYLDTSNQSIKDINAILGLDRKKILADAKILLPFWMAFPLLGRIIHVFRRLFLGKNFIERYYAERFDHENQKSIRRKSDSTRKGEATSKQFGTVGRGKDGSPVQAKTADTASRRTSTAAGSTTAKTQKARFKQQVQRLETEILDQGKSLEMSLTELIDKWNPMLDKTKRMDLVEDVNSMCRDYIRKLRISYRSSPPNLDSIKEMAKRLAGNDTFARIRDRNYLEKYIQLYLLKILGR